MQTLAPAGSIAVTEATRKLCEGYFNFRSLGPTKVKGVSETVELYEVIGLGALRTRLQRSAARGLTRFIGREDEMRTLWNRWERAREGEGQVVLIAGEPGIGKSRVIHQFGERLAGTSHRWVEGVAEPYFQNTPFHAVVAMVNQAFELNADQTPDESVNRLERVLQQNDIPPEAVSLIAQVLNLPVGERYAKSTLSPEQARKRLLATLAKTLFALAASQPLVLALEDLHWADASTLELLGLLVEQAVTSPVIVLVTARPEFVAPWPSKAHHAQMTLGRLRDREVREMVASVAEKTALTNPTIEAVTSRASGVPLFVEELTRAVLERGGSDASPYIPETLQNSLVARLDRLGPAKEAAQLASVIGREFSYELLSLVAPMGEPELQSSLMKLADSELIYSRGLVPEASYIFKHALIRDAAYEALLKTRRRELHSRIASTIDESFPDLAAAHPELLAHHYTEACSNEQAVWYWQRAGQQAVEHSAHVEAISHLNRGLELLKTLPPTPEHAALELEIQITLGVPIGIIKGSASAEGKAVYERARELCEQVGDSQQLCQVLWALWRLHHVRAEYQQYQQARKFGEEFLLLAQRNQNRDFLLQAHHSLWTTLILLGEFAVSKEHLDQAVEIYDPQLHHSHTFHYGGHDPGVCCRSARSQVLWYLG